MVLVPIGPFLNLRMYSLFFIDEFERISVMFLLKSWITTTHLIQRNYSFYERTCQRMVRFCFNFTRLQILVFALVSQAPKVYPYDDLRVELGEEP